MHADERFARWYSDHHDRIRRLCARILNDPTAAEDFAQETLLRAWERRDQIRDEDVGAWLSVVARNLCVSSMRRGWRVVPLEPEHDRPDHEADPAVAAMRSETRRNVRRALGGISRRHRRVLYLREVQDVGYHELGSELGMTPEGVRSIAFRARTVLRERLAAVGEGFSAVAFGVRIRVRAFRLRSRASRIVGEPTTLSVMQSSLNALLALGIVLAGTGTAAGAAARIAPRARTLPAEVHSVSNPAHSDGGARAGTGFLSGAPRAHDRELIPGADVMPFNVDDKRAETTLYLLGHEITIFFDGMDGDGLDPAYDAIDRGCASAPDVCDTLKEDPTR